MLNVLSDLAGVVLTVVAMVVFANLGFALLKPVVGRLSGTEEYAEGYRSADAMLIVLPLLLLAVGYLSYIAVVWGFRVIALIAP